MYISNLINLDQMCLIKNRGPFSNVKLLKAACYSQSTTQHDFAIANAKKVPSI